MTVCLVWSLRITLLVGVSSTSRPEIHVAVLGPGDVDEVGVPMTRLGSSTLVRIGVEVLPADAGEVGADVAALAVDRVALGAGFANTCLPGAAGRPAAGT